MITSPMSVVSRTRDRNAFTLLEVTIVLVMLVGLLAMAWPRMSGVARQTDLRGAAMTIKRALNEAKEQAVQRGREVHFIYKHESSGFQLSESRANERDADPAERNAPEAMGAELTTGAAFAMGSLPEGCLFLSENQSSADQSTRPMEITFYPDGRGTNHQLQVAFDTREMAISLSVRGLTGGVKISQVIHQDLAQDDPESIR